MVIDLSSYPGVQDLIDVYDSEKYLGIRRREILNWVKDLMLGKIKPKNSGENCERTNRFNLESFFTGDIDKDPCF